MTDRYESELEKNYSLQKINEDMQLRIKELDGQLASAVSTNN